ncbi:MAG: M20 family metallo-hydrolase [Ferruginibacter sp.]
MSEKNIDIITTEAIELLQQLIAVPSPSRQEDKTASLLENFLQQKGIPVKRLLNNIFCSNKFFDPLKPTVLLNSHHDTVAPNSNYTRNPYEATIEDGRLYGLGSTDAGASLVSLAAAFLYFYEAGNLPYNIVFAASAEEEVSGINGIEKLFADEAFKSLFGHNDSFAIVGEPTQLDLAIAEKGLMVIDCIAQGKPGHAAREEGDNALYKAMEAINWFKNYEFQRLSPALGKIKMTVTSVFTENKAHNVVPATCNFVVDIRITDAYSHEEILQEIKKQVNVEVKPRSTRLRSSSIPPSHPLVQAGIKLGKTTYGSPTTSDQALIPLPSLKCGPGFSAQSHTADEFVEIAEVKKAIPFYIEILNAVFLSKVF